MTCVLYFKCSEDICFIHWKFCLIASPCFLSLFFFFCMEKTSSDIPQKTSFALHKRKSYRLTWEWVKDDQIFMFQTCLTFLLWNTKGDVLRNVHAAPFYTIKVNGDQKMNNLSITELVHMTPVLHFECSEAICLRNVRNLRCYSLEILLDSCGHHLLLLYRKEQLGCCSKRHLLWSI